MDRHEAIPGPVNVFFVIVHINHKAGRHITRVDDGGGDWWCHSPSRVEIRRDSKPSLQARLIPDFSQHGLVIHRCVHPSAARNDGLIGLKWKRRVEAIKVPQRGEHGWELEDGIGQNRVDRFGASRKRHADPVYFEHALSCPRGRDVPRNEIMENQAAEAVTDHYDWCRLSLEIVSEHDHDLVIQVTKIIRKCGHGVIMTDKIVNHRVVKGSGGKRILDPDTLRVTGLQGRAIAIQLHLV